MAYAIKVQIAQQTSIEVSEEAQIQ